MQGCRAMRAEIQRLEFFLMAKLQHEMKIIYWGLKTDLYQYRVTFINEQKEVYIRELRKISNNVKQRTKFPEVLGLAVL